jgi:hypothetical protein
MQLYKEVLMSLSFTQSILQNDIFYNKHPTHVLVNTKYIPWKVCLSKINKTVYVFRYKNTNGIDTSTPEKLRPQIRLIFTNHRLTRTDYSLYQLRTASSVGVSGF